MESSSIRYREESMPSLDPTMRGARPVSFRMRAVLLLDFRHSLECPSFCCFGLQDQLLAILCENIFMDLRVRRGIAEGAVCKANGLLRGFRMVGRECGTDMGREGVCVPL